MNVEGKSRQNRRTEKQKEKRAARDQRRAERRLVKQPQAAEPNKEDSQ